jgi:two-component system, cell cycle sensor histidine kinase and response regulator CckA
MNEQAKTHPELSKELSILKRRMKELEKSASARTQTDESLQEPEERFRGLVENVNDIFYEMDGQGMLHYVSPAVERIFGYNQSEIIGRPMTDFLAPEEAQSAMMNIRNVMDGHIAAREYRVRLKPGGIGWIRVFSSPIRRGDQVAGIRGVLSDITERKRAQEALRESEARYRLLAENATDVIWIAGMDMRLTYVSPSVTKLLGFTVKEAMALMMQQAFTPAAFEKAMQIFAEEMAIESGGHADPTRSRIVELELVRKDGNTVPVEGNFCFLRDPAGKVTGVLSIVRDITERKRAGEEKRSLEERLQRSEKMEALGRLAGGVAHDLNNVLGVLTGYSELLKEHIPRRSRSKRYVDKILQSTEKAAAIIDDLLTLARRGVTVSDVVNLNSVISDFLKTPAFEKAQYYHPRVTFTAECDKNLLNIQGSPVHLEKTLMNLVSNAAEAIPGKGAVVIRTQNRYLDVPVRGYDEVKEGDYAVLTVSDTGTGILLENVEKIFEPFYTKKTMGRSGTGQGLAIVWGAVKDHAGYIDVETEIGQGTTFTLYFPVTREKMLKPHHKVPMARYMGKGESVLVVDDVAEQRDVASGLLTRLGYEVHVVSSGEEAVEYLTENHADILVLDMIMRPGIDGLETYERILEINPKQKAIIVSGYSETARVRKAQKIGAGAYLKKPYLMEEIGVAIRAELNL